MTTRFQVLFVTDSLGFPRTEPEPVMYEDTYISLLKEAFPECDVIHQGRGGATIVDLYKHSAYYHGTLKPDLTFIQSGIVDSAPRALTVTEQQIISRLPLLSRPLTALVRKYSRSLRLARKMTYTSSDTFADYVGRFESLFGNVHWIGILPASDSYEAKLQGIRLNVERYNAILRGRRYVSTEHFQPSDIMADFHHLNRSGNRKLFDALTEVVRRELGLETTTVRSVRPARTSSRKGAVVASSAGE